MQTFHQYKTLRESDENQESGIATTIVLGKNNDYKPFNISDDPKNEKYGQNAALAPIVRAFKSGANWGWSKDDEGNDKAVKISGKKLYLSGGSVRSHLFNEKDNGPIQLVTNASPDEIYHILKQNGFDFVGEDGSTKKSLNTNKKGKQQFSVRKKNRKGRPFSFSIMVDGKEFLLEIFRKSRGKLAEDDEPETGSLSDDSSSRDFTLNGMYIELTNDNGSNDKLSDFHGGIHHIKSGRIMPIGGLNAMDNRPDKMIRFIRFMHGYGNPSHMPDEQKKYMSENGHSISKIDRKYMMDELKKGINKKDKDSKNLLKLLEELGILKFVFPGKVCDTEFPDEVSEIGDKFAPIAWMLRFNNPDMISDVGFDHGDFNKIKLLIKALGMSESMSHDTLDDLLVNYTTSGVTDRKLREWATKLGKINSSVVDAFISYTKMPRIKHVDIQENGSEVIDPAFADLYDPFTGSCNQSEISERRKILELDQFRKQLNF